MKHFLAALLCLAALTAHAGDNRWTSTGPYGGLFARFAFHPKQSNLIFASGSSDLYRSRNGGNSWERLDLFGGGQYPSASIVRFHPQDANRILAANYSVFTSTDQGTNWQEVSTMRLNGDSFMDLEFHPSNAQILYGITYRSGVLKSTDGGSTWSPKNTGIKMTPVRNCCETPQLEVDPSNGNTVYALTSSFILYKSTNGGDSWKAIGPKFQTASGLVVDPKNPQTLYAGGSSGAFKSTNGGASWSQVLDRGGFLSIDPRNPQTVYAAAGLAYKTTNSGAGWTLLPGLDQVSVQAIGIHPATNTIFAGAEGSGISRSKNGGFQWQTVNAGVDNRETNKVLSHTDRRQIMFALEFPDVQMSKDAGRRWEPFRALRNFKVGGGDVHPANPNLIAFSGLSIDVNGNTALSSDGGKSWAVSGPSGATVPGPNNIRFHPQDQKTVFILPADNNFHPLGVSKSTDFGRSWKPVNSGLSDKNTSVIAVDPENGSNVYVGTSSGKIFGSANGASSWKNSSAGLVAGRIRFIAVDPADSKILYATAEGKGGGPAVLFKSTNGGSSWVRRTNGLPDVAFLFSIAIDPRNSRTIYVCSNLGLHVSTDGAENWSTFDASGLESQQAFDVFLSGNDILIGTGRGVWSYTRKSVSGGPVIDQILPGSAKTGDAVTINGRNFGPTQGSSAITFAGASASAASSWSDSSVQIRVPSGARSGPVLLTAGGKRSNSFEFIVLPSTGTIEPSSGPSSGGTRVTIVASGRFAGSGFNVLFGRQLAKDMRFIAPNIIICTAPAGSGTVDVLIFTAGALINAGTFTYQ